MKENIEVKMPEQIAVKPYLTYAEIQQIANQVAQFDSWAERETTIDIMLLNYVTDISSKDIEAIGHEAFVSDGTMERIRGKVLNFGKVYDAIAYTESTARALAQILKELPEMMEPLKEMQEKYAKRKK